MIDQEFILTTEFRGLCKAAVRRGGISRSISGLGLSHDDFLDEVLTWSWLHPWNLGSAKSTYCFNTVRWVLSRLQRAAYGRNTEQLQDVGRTEPDEVEAMDFINYVLSSKALSEAERALVAARFIEGRTLAEIGVSLSITREGVRQKLDKVIERLRLRLTSL